MADKGHHLFRARAQLGAILLVASAWFVPSATPAAQFYAVAESTATGPYARLDHRRIERIAQRKCAVCHGPDGNSANATIPKIAGQKAPYIYDQLQAFKHDWRTSQLMNAVAHKLSAEQMTELARFYARQMPNADVPTKPKLAQLGERLYYSRELSCALCHGSSRSQGMMHPNWRGMGMMGMMGPGMMGAANATAPMLRGQHAAYTLIQLDKFADGTRTGAIMNPIARRLTEKEREALAQFLSGLQ